MKSIGHSYTCYFLDNAVTLTWLTKMFKSQAAPILPNSQLSNIFNILSKTRYMIYVKTKKDMQYGLQSKHNLGTTTDNNYSQF